VEWVLPWLNSFLEKSMELALFTSPQIMVFLVVLILVTTFLSGFYPALILSGFNPNEVLKNKISGTRSSGAFLRKGLVVFQFFIAQALIIGTIVVSQQMDYFKSKPLGFDKDFIIDVQMPDTNRESMMKFKDRLEANANISNVSFSVGSPSSENNISTGYFLTARGKDEEFDISLKVADRNYMETYGLKLVAGEWFSESQEKQTLENVPEEERSYVFVINTTAAKQLGFSNPEDIIGKNLTIGLNGINAPVIGVIEDFHITSLHKTIKQVSIISYPYFYYNAVIRLQPEEIKENLAFVERNW
jgi:ABC-type antimicrobial peptide transport system permease subunit